ncbi:cupin domain-containing protein [candidate division KSB1 bacterium]
MLNSIDFYPELIINLPEADIPFDGVRGWLLQGGNNQLVFFELEPIGIIPPHSHGAQWGTVLEGEIELTINDVTKTYGKGDSYYIPGGAVHSVTLKTKSFVLDFFADKDRYQVIG